MNFGVLSCSKSSDSLVCCTGGPLWCVLKGIKALAVGTWRQASAPDRRSRALRESVCNLWWHWTQTASQESRKVVEYLSWGQINPALAWMPPVCPQTWRSWDVDSTCVHSVTLLSGDPMPVLHVLTVSVTYCVWCFISAMWVLLCCIK